MKPTFNQLVAACITGLSLLLIGAIYFFPGHGDANAKTQALTAVAGCLSAGVIYLMKASSDAAHATANNQMIEALSKSSPATKEPEKATPEAAPAPDAKNTDTAATN